MPFPGKGNEFAFLAVARHCPVGEVTFIAQVHPGKSPQRFVSALLT